MESSHTPLMTRPFQSKSGYNPARSRDALNTPTHVRTGFRTSVCGMSFSVKRPVLSMVVLVVLVLSIGPSWISPSYLDRSADSTVDQLDLVEGLEMSPGTTRVTGKEKKDSDDMTDQGFQDSYDMYGKEEQDSHEMYGKEEQDSHEMYGKEKEDSRDMTGKDEEDSYDMPYQDEKDSYDMPGKEFQDFKDVHEKETEEYHDMADQEKEDSLDMPGKENHEEKAFFTTFGRCSNMANCVECPSDFVPRNARLDKQTLNSHSKRMPPRPESPRKANAVITILCRNKDMAEVLTTLGSFEPFINSRYAALYVLIYQASVSIRVSQ